MIKMLSEKPQNRQTKKIDEEDDYGWDSLYNYLYNEGKIDGSIRITKNLIKDGIDFETISRNTGFSIKALERLKRDL